MNCWACGRPAKGYRHLDLRYPLTDRRRIPARWVFCSRRCQDAFHHLYATRRRRDPTSVEELLPMTLPLTPSAQRACLRALTAVAERIGFEVPLARYTPTQAVQLIEAVIAAYETVLQADSPLRGPDGFEDLDIPF